jgi:Raf kinase inhibitor-like YbhB/YbcL family protein
MKKNVFLIFIFLLLLSGFFSSLVHKPLTKKPSITQKPSATIKNKHMQITSPAFQYNSSMPERYTCDGAGVNPPLQFGDVPANAISLVLLMEDPDIPSGGVFDHWVIYNIDPQTTEIPESSIPPGEQGLNSARKTAYYPACPPDREHRYLFKLYALDTQLQFEIPGSVTKQMVLERIQGHIIAQAELIGLYNRPQNR